MTGNEEIDEIQEAYKVGFSPSREENPKCSVLFCTSKPTVETNGRNFNFKINIIPFPFGTNFSEKTVCYLKR